MRDHSSQLVDHQKQQQLQEQFNNEETHFNDYSADNDPQNQISQNDNKVAANCQWNHHWSQSIFHYESTAIGL